jgi:choloylglycine hydrolase
MAISDATGDSAIFEYIDGKLVIHHGPEYVVMTNDPIYSEQLALDTYWEKAGGANFLPGTISPADRYVRLSYWLKTLPNYEDRSKALATAFSLIRGVSVPIGSPVGQTLWRTVADHDAKTYYFDSASFPSVFWVDLNKVDLKPGAKVKTLKISKDNPLAGEVSSQFKEAEPFEFL